MTTTGTPVDNGVNVEALLDARQVLSDQPAAAQVGWRATCTWQKGTHSQSVVHHFTGLGGQQSHRAALNFDVDHPECFAAEDNGATPVEYVLVALAGCLTASIASVAQMRQIQLRSINATIEGDMNVLGILGADPDVRNGFESVKIHFDIDADATAEEIEALVAHPRSARPPTTSSPTRPTSPSGSTDPPATTPDRSESSPIAHHHDHYRSRPRRPGHEPPLTERSIDHVVIERGEVGDSWRTKRWPTLRLLTPNWQTRLPGLRYQPADPDGYLPAAEVAELLSGYAEVIEAPVHSNTRVTALRSRGSIYEVLTDQGT